MRKNKININTFEIRARKKEIELKSIIPNNIPTVILGDSMRLWQILSNLVDNALKFTPKGEITIQLKTKSKTQDHILLEFNVIDTGIGIPQEKFNSIFELPDFTTDVFTSLPMTSKT